MMGSGPSSPQPERVVLLVTTPLTASVNGVLATFSCKVARLTPALSDWPQDSPPRVTENFCFARHMAVCLIPLEVWDNKDVPFPAKFAAGSFWEHLGSALSESASKPPSAGRNDGGGRTWASESIESIEAVQRLGTTHMSDGEIYEQLFAGLFEDWVYLPIWWNCQDFAARMGYLLDPKASSLQDLKSLLDRLKQSMATEVVDTLLKGTSMASGLGAFAGFLLAPSLGLAYASVCSVSTQAYLQEQYVGRSRKELFMKNLESRFPKLRELHG
ncbi:hypothetical protein RB594_009633 [Gaeumannomyces avenae]